MKDKTSDTGFRRWSGLACFALVYAVWAVWEHWGVPVFWVLNSSITAALEAVAIKNLIWLLPMAAFIRLGTPMKWSVRSLFSGRFPWVLVLCSICGMCMIIHTLHLVIYRGSTLLSPFEPVFILLAICAGVTEELLFRGFILNSTLASFPKPIAVILTGLCFVLIHYTGLPFGMPVLEMISLRALQIFVMGTFFSILTIRTRDLKVPMLLHAVWNGLAYFYGLY